MGDHHSHERNRGSVELGPNLGLVDGDAAPSCAVTTPYAARRSGPAVDHVCLSVSGSPSTSRRGGACGRYTRKRTVAICYEYAGGCIWRFQHPCWPNRPCGILT